MIKVEIWSFNQRNNFDLKEDNLIMVKFTSNGQRLWTIKKKSMRLFFELKINLKNKQQ